MKKMAESNKKSSIPIVLQSFGHEQYNQSSNVSSRMRSYPKKNENNASRGYYGEETPGLTPQTSRKRLQNDDRTITQHYQNLEKILINENSNLKQQNSYLTSQVRKSLKRQEKLKQELRALNYRLKTFSEDINRIQTEYVNVKDLIERQMSYLSIGLKSNNVYELKNMVWRYIDEISNHLRLQIDHHFSSPQLPEKQDNEQSKSEIENQIEFLTKRLETLLHQETGESRGPSVRKECIQISKQLKQLKEKSRKMSNITVSQNHMSQLVRGSRARPSLPVQKSRSRESKCLLRSDSIKQEAEEFNIYRPQTNSKITKKTSINKDNKGVKKKEEERPK